MANATVGALKVVLGLDTSQFEKGLNAAQKHMRGVGRDLQRVGRDMQQVGAGMTAAITAPLAGLGIAVTRTAADFEAAMIRVGISTGAAGAQMEALSDLAREIGRETVFSASTAAEAMDMLAKAGISVEDILGGAARAAVDLAAAAGSELDPAAAAITDSMAQFNLVASHLPGVVNQITGAVNESKLDFSDFQMAMGQAGGVAANLGVTFEDFNTVLAGTSPLFSSGSDAGTSFKTFLLSLVPTTTKAATAMRDYGLSFHDAAGNLKPMAEIAQMLQERLAHLSDETRTDVLKTIFGTDAMRTAIGLMQQGGEGLENIAARIAETDAAAQAAARMGGLNGQLEQLGGAFEEMAIAIGESGLLDVVAKIVSGMADMMTRVAEASPGALQFGLVLAGIAAAAGPLIVVIGSIVGALGTLATAFGGGGVLAGMLPLLGPIGLAAAAVAAAFMLWGDQIIPALRAFGDEVAKVLGPEIAPLLEAAKGLFASLGAVIAQLFGGNGPSAEAFRAFGAIVGRVLTAAVQLLTGAVNTITEIFNALAAALRGDWSAMWGHLGGAVGALVTGLIDAFATLLPRVTQSLQRLAEGAQTWLVQKLGETLLWVARRAKDVGDAFFTLYDRVVGNSYIPDMVTEVGQWMAQLDDRMVQPARRATETVAEAFENLQARAGAAMEALLTDRERMDLELRRDMSGYEAFRSGGAWTQEQYDEAARRRRAQYAQDQRGLDTPTNRSLNLAEEVSASIQGVMDDLRAGLPETLRQGVLDAQAAFDYAGREFGDRFAYGIEQALRGDWRGVLETVLGDVWRNALSDFGKRLYEQMNGAGGKSGGGIGSLISGALSMFGGGMKVPGTTAIGTGMKIPGFKTGGSFTVAGAGGPDSQLMSFWATPGEMVDIRTPGQMAESGGNYFDLRGAVMTSDLIEQMNRIGKVSEDRAYGRAMTDVPGLAQGQQAKRQIHSVGRAKR